jgi:hypothetical protein
MKRGIMLVIVVSLALFILVWTAGLIQTGRAKASLPPKAALDDGRLARPARELDRSPLDARQINSSTVNFVWPGEVFGGGTHDLCFNVTVESPDLDYLDRFEVDLPDAWTINQVYPMAASSDCNTSSIAGWEATNLIYWQTDAESLPSYCGAWWNGVYDFCTNVTVPSCGGPWSLPWTIFGDGWGQDPHQVSGLTDLVTCRQLELVLSPSGLEFEGCHTLTETLTFNLRNDTATDAVFDIAYSIPSYNARISGPDGIYLGDGVDQDFLVELAPDACLPDGEQVLATIEASGAGFSATATITQTIRHWPTCPACPLTLSPSALDIDGCQNADLPWLLSLRNETGTDGTFDIAYSVSTGNASLIGPASLYVLDGVEQDFLFYIQPDGCLSDGEQILGTVEASGAGITATTAISFTVRHVGCPQCLTRTHLPLVLRAHE